jgi:hypothetical protein
MKRIIALGSLTLIACGGGSGARQTAYDGGQSIIVSGLSCPAVKPCGGNPVGTWNVTNFCLAGLGESMAAQSQTDGGVLSGSQKCLTEIRLVVNGVIEFQADGTYATKNMTKARLESKFNDSCLREQGKSCVTLDGCGPVGADGICACTKDESSDSSPNSTTGVFKAARDVLYLAGNDSDSADASTTSTTSACTSFLCDVQNRKSIDLMDYCVDGDTMKFIESESSDIYTVITAVRASGPGTIAVSPLPTQAPDSPAPVAEPTAVNAGDPPVTFKACGGNIVGTWNISKLSLDSSSQARLLKYVRSFDENGECAVAIDVTDTGSLVFQPHSSNFNGGAGYCSFAENPAIAVSYSSACLAAKAKSCADLDKSLKAEMLASDATAVAGCALASDGNCTCTKAHQYSFPNCEYDTSSIMSDFYTAPVDISHDVAATDTHYYCVSGNTLSVQNYEFSIDGFSGSVVMTAVRTNDPATGRDAGTDAPRPDAAPDLPRADAAIDGNACSMGKACSSDSDCSNGLTCQKFAAMNGQALNSSVCMPLQCATCTGRTCVYDDDPKVCGFVECQSNDAGAADAAVDKPKGDVAPVDAMPVPLSAMAPSMAAVCPAAASAPCGGDVTGSWRIVGMCDNWLSESELLSQIAMDCSIAVDFIDTGTAVFSSDGTCIMDEKSIYNTDYATSCLTAASDTCAASDGRIKKEIGTDYVSDASCATSSADVCMCSNTFDPPAAADVCTYSLKGSQLTFLSPPSTFSAKAYDYCVQGNTMTIFFTSWSAAGAAAGDKAGMVLNRGSAVDAGIDGL